jgi:hypothetical protein
LYKAKTKTGFNVTLNFRLYQHNRDAELLQSFMDFLGCGRYFAPSNKNSSYFVVSNFSDIDTKIIPFFDKYNILGVKAKDYDD